MFKFIISKIIGTQNERELKRLRPKVDLISSFEPQISRLTDIELRSKTDELKKRLEAGQTLDDILPEAFAVVRETGKRTINMRHFDVQLMGGIVLHEGKIAEMATGEGKTLVATLPVYLNALTGKGVHIVTVNDYLAKRDREWMGPIYEFLGLTIGVIQHDMEPKERQKAYNSDITYGTNNEFGFDYLRDNMVVRLEDMAQRELHYAIVDEVDSILVDEARTPLIISGPAEESTDKYYKIDKIIPLLNKGADYQIEEKTNTVALSEDGVKKVEKLLGFGNLYEDVNMEIVHHVNQALRAHTLFKRDVDYVVKDNEVLIVDEFTGRLMPGRRYSEGLHQALEAKEGVKIERENQTLATITFQNYFRMYEKLAGMTGTAATEASEFNEIYKLDVIVIPTNKSLIRTHNPDVIYKTEKEKFNAVADEIIDLHKKGRPVLVGTISIEKSERLSQLLHRRNVPHQVLNAKYHEKEAQIVAQAGRLAAVTIATNMAGRGTDILLGGNAEFMANDLLHRQGIEPHQASPEERSNALIKVREQVLKEHEKVVELGGLHITGTERHEARRIDNQLRGRSGRQGDPGSSRFYLSLEDELMRIFGSDRIASIMNRLGMEEGQDIQHPLVTKSIEVAQKRVESRNFDIRKHLLEYDNVMNKQREVIYEERRRVLEGGDLKEHILEMIEETLDNVLDAHLNKSLHRNEWDFKGLAEWMGHKFKLNTMEMDLEEKDRDQIREYLFEKMKESLDAREKNLGEEAMKHLERIVMLNIIDSRWKDHLYAMDNLKEGIGLRAYGQKDPLVEYQHEAFDMFSGMTSHIKEEVLEFIFKVQAVHEELPAGRRGVSPVFAPQHFLHPEAVRMGGVSFSSGDEGREAVPPESRLQMEEARHDPYKRESKKVGRNEPCPCGSGKKHKKCCGK